MTRKGLLVINLGTPESPEPSALAPYLRQFLMDPYVVDLPAPLRWLLVHAIIVPRRKSASAALYRKIWTERGSPLFFHLLDLASGLSRELGENWLVEPAMRYGKPSIEEAVSRLKSRSDGDPSGSIQEIVLFPLYPQYSEATTRSSLEEARRWVRNFFPGGMPLREVAPFHADPGFIESFHDSYQETTSGPGEGFRPDFVLFSFHGLPESQIRKAAKKGAGCGECLARPSCENPVPFCYRSQSFATARALAHRLGIQESGYGVSFQSRLGISKWLSPSTEETYARLARQGVRKLLVLCPSFVADCLETLEEIEIRGGELFRAVGGEELRLVSSLNSRPVWVRAAARLVSQAELC